MIGAISLMRRRKEIDQAEFQKHWLEVHGPLVCKMPGLRRYQQAHVTEALSAPARAMAIDGFAQLFFNSVADRAVAYASSELAACDRDSPLFIGQVTRAITEMTEFSPSAGAAKLMLLFPRGEVVTEQELQALPGLSGCVLHRVTDQGRAPNSVVAELVCPLAFIAELWFTSPAALHDAAAIFPRAGAYAVREHEFL
jgi:uncharacterized protein (TIGR02118 family)